ncbi:hypothetical protein [Kaarinaea lacus]
MKKRLAMILAFFGVSSNNGQPQAYPYELNYDNLIHLDAENLAEQGIKEAYEELKPNLKKYIEKPAEIIEKLDNNIPSYSVVCNGKNYEIYGSALVEGQSWGRAGYALFNIVNEQLKGQKVKFYAINGGNDLGGMILTEEEYNNAIKSLERKTDWPYIPTLEHPWYGQAK